MDDHYQYQMIEQGGVQELVIVSMDENSLPCIYLRDIDRVFPNATTISCWGLRIPFVVDASNVPKQPLRIPYLENRVLEVESDNSALEWSHNATAARISAATALGEASLTTVNTVHTAPIPGLLDIDPNDIHSDIDNDANIRDDISVESCHIDMFESATSSSSSEEEVVEPLCRQRRSPHTASALELLTTNAASQSPPRTVQSSNNVSFDSPHDRVTGVTALAPPTKMSAVSSHYLTNSGPELDGQSQPPPPPYQLIDNTIPIDNVLGRISTIKHISQRILTHKYEAASCPHPPLFVLLPENVQHWSRDDILHNKMRLHFLCSCCEHDAGVPSANLNQRTAARKRNVHVHESEGFEIRLDQFQDQMLLIKFGYYILNLLRMLQYGVSLEDVFVQAAFDRPILPTMNTNGTTLSKSGMDTQLFSKLKQNVERSILFMETLLGVRDEYDKEATEAVCFLDMNDFRTLDWIVKRPSYWQSSSTELSSSTASGSSSSDTGSSITDIGRELAMSDVYLGGSGLYKVLGTGDRVQWACEKFYTVHHGNLDRIYSNKLKLLQATFDTHTRSSICTGTSESQLNTRVIMITKIRALLRIDVTIDWDFWRSQLDTLASAMRNEARSISTVALRFSKRVAPLAWNKHSPIRGENQQPISAVIDLIKDRGIKHLILEGDVDLISIPNIGTMDLSNLDILSIMKTNNRGYHYGNNISGGDSIHGNDTLEAGSGTVPQTVRIGSAQDEYIPELTSFLQSCSLLTELSLGFPELIPGHVRILKTCIARLSSLRRVDLFRVLGSRVNNRSNSEEGQGGTAINRKLELSANISASRVTRLYMAECRATAEGKARLLESLEELLMDEGSHLEDLELYFVGFSDKHAHALEVGTQPILEPDYCQLRRLVIHGNGLGYGGAMALRQVLMRATGSDRPSIPQENGMATTIAEPESLSFGTMREETTLMHLELRSMDSLRDHDWSTLLNGSNLQRLLTLDLQGAGFGDRAMATLAMTSRTQDSVSPPHSPTTPTSESSTLASSPPTAPPAFFSPSASLQLQTFRLSSSALSHHGAVYMQEFLSRSIHLSTISLHGFRRVTSGDWIDILARISFRWIEVFEIVSLGYDDDCARYLADRFKTRESIGIVEEDSQAALPAYCVRPSIDSIASAMTTSSISTSSSSTSPSIYRSTRRESFSSRLITSTVSSLSTRQKPRNTDSKENVPLSPSIEALPISRPNPSRKYLEIDLRYTDVSSKGLALLKADVADQAKKVVVHTRDGEEEEDGKELARPRAKFNGDNSAEKDRHNRTVASRVGAFAGASSGTGISPAAILLPSATSFYHGSGGSRSSNHHHHNTDGASDQVITQSTRPSAFMKLKSVFKKH
ncbi:MAG: hypothetical protein J3Q66DRAFT_440077 [Benniella sp.]|nr:MAG: hypothetical protein J3Q66DRAFT_440077 [Benniella sp.]